MFCFRRLNSSSVKGGISASNSGSIFISFRSTCTSISVCGAQDACVRGARATLFPMYRQAAFTACPGYLKSRADSRFLSSALLVNNEYALSVFVLDTPGKSGNTFRRPAAYRIHGNLTPPWFSPSRPQAEVSLSCDASMLRGELPRVYHRPTACSLSGRLLHLP